jgi:apolipoprotein N-acyltransferase
MKKEADAWTCIRLLLLAAVSWGELGLTLTDLEHASYARVGGWLLVAGLLSLFAYVNWPKTKIVSPSREI